MEYIQDVPRFFATVLQNFKFLADFDFRFLLAVAPKMKGRRWTSSETIIKEEEDGHSMFFVHTGRVVIYLKGKRVAELKDQSCFGELAVLTTNSTRTATVVADQITVTWELSREDLEKALVGHPSAAKKLRELAQARLARDSARSSNEHVARSTTMGRVGMRPSLGQASLTQTLDGIKQSVLSVGDGRGSIQPLHRASRIIEEGDFRFDEDDQVDEKDEDEERSDDSDAAPRTRKGEGGGSDSDDSMGLPSWSVKRKQKGGKSGPSSATLPFIADFSDVLHNLIAGAPAATAVEKIRSTVRTFMRAWRRVVDVTMRDQRESLERQEQIRKWVKRLDHKRLIAQEISLARHHVDFTADVGLTELLTWSAMKRTMEEDMDSIAPVGSTHHMQSAFNTKSSHMDSAFQMKNSTKYSMRSTTSYLSSTIARELYSVSRHRRQRKHSRGVVTRNLLKKLKRTRPLLGAMEERMEESLDEPLDEPTLNEVEPLYGGRRH